MLPTKKIERKLQDVRICLPTWTIINCGFIKTMEIDFGLCSEVIVSRSTFVGRHFETNRIEISVLNITTRLETFRTKKRINQGRFGNVYYLASNSISARHKTSFKYYEANDF